MNRARLPQLHSVADGSFEPKRRNLLFLRDDEPLDDHLKRLKIGDSVSPMSLSKATLQIDGDLAVSGDFISSSLKTPSVGFDIIVGAAVLSLLADGDGIQMSTETLEITATDTIEITAADTLEITAADTLELTSDILTINSVDEGQIIIQDNGTPYAKFQGLHYSVAADASTFLMYGDGGTSTDDFLFITVAETGAASIGTIDSDGDLAHMTLAPNGSLQLAPSDDKTYIQAGAKFAFGGVSATTYITESSNDELDFYVGDVLMLKMKENEIATNTIAIPAQVEFYFDGGGNTYIKESSDDTLDIYVGNGRAIRIKEGSNDVIDLEWDVTLTAGKKLLFDTVFSGHTYITESSDDILDFYVGAINMLKLDETNDKIQFTGGTIELLDTTDAADLFSITVAASGATTIATVDDGAAVGHLTLQPDGDFILDAASQKTNINTTDKLYFDGGTETYIHEVSTDKMELVVGGDEMLTLDEANDRITLEATKLAYKIGSGGDEFSVTDSAYAGTILGCRVLGHDAGRVGYTITNAFAALHADAFVRFIAPPSGVVEVFVQAGYLDSLSGRFIYFGLSDNATYNTIGAEHEELVNMTDETDQQIIQNTWVISGLTAGDTYNYWFGLKANAAGSGALNYGGTGSGHYSPFIMKVTALPTAVQDFAVYD